MKNLLPRGPGDNVIMDALAQKNKLPLDRLACCHKPLPYLRIQT
jgi:hypothetical protein